MNLLEIQGLSASYGGGAVIDGLSLNIPEATVTGIVGPNGHGKTTLLRSISGLMPHQSGVVQFAGQRISGLRPEAIATLGIVHVPQGDLVYKHMTVLENLLVGGYANQTRAETVGHLDEAFALFPKLSDRRTQMASSLSGGERRMLGIARGLMMADAKLLMLDEPSLGLAPIVIDQIYEAILKLTESGLTIIVVEENIHRVSTVAAHLHLIDRGEIVWHGSPNEIGANRQFIQTYLGA